MFPQFLARFAPFQKKNSGPPTAALFNKVKITPLGKKKDNKNHSSRFRVSQDRELQKLPLLKGKLV